VGVQNPESNKIEMPMKFEIMSVLREYIKHYCKNVKHPRMCIQLRSSDIDLELWPWFVTLT